MTLNATYIEKVTWYDLLDESLIAYIPDHWLNFEPPSKGVHFTLGVVYIVLLLLGTLSNGTIIFLYIRCRCLRTPSNLLIVNLAASDFVMIAKTPVFIINSFQCGPALGKTGCQIYGFLGGLTGTSAIMTIAAMALERFVTIRWPFKGRLDHRLSVLSVGFIWAYSLFFSSIPLLEIYSRYVPEGYLTSCSFDYLSRSTSNRTFILIYFLAAFCVPFAIIVYSYVGIVLEMRASDMTFRLGAKSQRYTFEKSHISKTSTGSKILSRQRQELHRAKMSACIIALWLVAWTPYAIVALIGVFGDSTLLTPTVTMLPALFAKVAAILNPVIYGHSHPKFREQAMRIFCCHHVTDNSVGHATARKCVEELAVQKI
ncbi:Opsin, ultraviolet-sensitive [Halotydeus destructor]|nr:Opsin, ultraviolet-sensitive [Halotydeus destructor]